MKLTSPQELAPSTERRSSPPRDDWSRWKRRLAWPSLWIAGKLTKRDALVVFNYHQVSPVFDPARHSVATWSSLVDFERAVEHLQSSYRFVRLSEGLRLLQEGSLRGIVVALSFDDGDFSVAEHVVPFLTKRRVPASLFVNSAYIGSHECAPEHALNYWRNAPSCTPERRQRAAAIDLSLMRRTASRESYWHVVDQIRALGPPDVPLSVTLDFLRGLDESLFEVGLHGHEHFRFSMLDDGQRRRNLEENARILGTLATYRPIFALPYGRPFDWDRQTVRLCLEMGLDVCMADGGVARSGDLVVRRIPAEGIRSIQRTLVRELLGR
ncbi:MAG TPA: polysaccharide deacetylase family protein [Verrucomicrobiae bacterium]|nr:polysaccharide deacetylase family protein [Verrucomicrobiae bacterium]